MNVFARAHELAPDIAARAEEIERLRTVPHDLVDRLREAGVFRMYVPRSHGGEEMAPADALDVLEELARADGSVGWVAAIGADSPAMFAYLPPESYDKVYAEGPDVIHAGSLVPRGRAVREDGGYRYTGMWPFASGCLHADYLAFNAIVETGGDDGAMELRVGFLPASEVEIRDTWHVSGLKGTGSHDLALDGRFVPDEWTASFFQGPPVVRHPLDSVPLLGRLGLEIAAVGTGIARGALEDLIEIARNKRSVGLGPRIAEDPVFQLRVGEIDMDLRTARLLLRHLAVTDFERVTAGDELTPELTVERRATMARATTTAASVVDRCYGLSGTTGLYETSPLQRRLRDVHALTQHILFTSNAFTPLGASLLGEPFNALPI
jgi:indole-3-acetate monooxygenase